MTRLTSRHEDKVQAVFERLNTLCLRCWFSRLWFMEMKYSAVWSWRPLLSPISPSMMYLQKLEVKEHLLTFPTYSGSSLPLAVLGLILHLEVYWVAEVSCLSLVYTFLRIGPYVLSAHLAWRGLTQTNGAIHSLIILGIFAFGRGCGASFKKEEEKTVRCCQLCFPKGLIRKYVVRICSAFLWFDQEYPGGMSGAIWKG